jgi:hypothetical protein
MFPGPGLLGPAPEAENFPDKKKPFAGSEE